MLSTFLSDLARGVTESMLQTLKEQHNGPLTQAECEGVSRVCSSAYDLIAKSKTALQESLADGIEAGCLALQCERLRSAVEAYLEMIASVRQSFSENAPVNPEGGGLGMLLTAVEVKVRSLQGRLHRLEQWIKEKPESVNLQKLREASATCEAGHGEGLAEVLMRLRSVGER